MIGMDYISKIDSGIRVGFLLDSFNLRAWEQAMIREITGLEGVSVVVIVMNESYEGAEASQAKRFLAFSRTVIYRLYSRIDRALFRAQEDLFEREDGLALFKDSPVIRVTPSKTPHSDYISDDDVRTIQQFKPDVLIRIGFRILRGPILNAAPLGVWSLHHGDNTVNHGGPPGFWEVFNGVPATGAVLQVLNEDLDNGLVISRTLSSTHRWSVNRNKHRLYRKALYLIPNALKEVKRKGKEAFLKEIMERNAIPSFYSYPLFRNPGNLKMLGLLARHLGRSVLTACRKALYKEAWVLIYGRSDRIVTSPRNMKTLLPPRGRFWADPHVIHEGGRHYVFFEEYLNSKGKGRISLIIMDDAGNISSPATVLEKPWHLSYPFVLKHGNEYFMIPDSAEQGTIDLYRCTDFPFRWEHHKTLVSGIYAVDPTVLLHNGLWWLFVGVRKSAGMSACDELHLFHADRLDTDQWSPHPLNPLSSDVTRARPAGKLFVHRGRLYRPSQDCSVSYGYGVRINEVTRLDREAYEEREVGRIMPKWNHRVTGVHTLTVAEGLTLLDARIKFPRFTLKRTVHATCE